ncbi:MAG TPA: nucleoside hydrolase [Candidatus Acidoferrales bacterium]|jgi:inosine-uridine nucleoside N-ribohydrolase|nr:nucleoside hydrolase [Candidatus Acidoferrales bacterium]
MQFPGQEKPPVGIVFDTGLSGVDDALAMALLFGLDGKREVRVVSMSVSRSNLQAAIYCDVVGRFYAGAVSGAIGFGGRTLPVGMATDGRQTAEEPLFAAPLARKTVEGKPAYASDIHRLEDTADPGAVMRNALTAQQDQNAIVVLAGPATNLVRLLDVGGAKDWISRKVRFLAVAGGAFGEGPAEENIKSDPSAAKRLFAEWPTPIVAAGREIGDKVLYPGSSVEKDFAWSTAHPVVDAYRAFHPMPYDAPTGAMSAVLYAGRPQENYFKLSDPGVISVQDDGRTRFTPSASGKHRHLILDPAQTEHIVKTYTEIASAKPVPRPQRIFQKKQQDQKKQ